MTIYLPKDDRETVKLQTFHHRNVCTLYRKEATDEKVSAALSIAQDSRLPRRSIEFVHSEQHFSGRWKPVAGLGAAFEKYIESLCKMDVARRGTHGKTLTEEIVGAFDAVSAAAATLEALDWPVNWQQSVRLILEMTDFGVQDGALVNRYTDEPDVTTLGRRLELAGGLTFFIQSGIGHKAGRVRPMLMTDKNRQLYGDTILHLDRTADALEKQWRYSSEWMKLAAGGRFIRIHI